jgi:hypothetical protein
MNEREESKRNSSTNATKSLPKRRSRAFGRALLSKLPKLAVSRWDVTDTLDVYQDMQGIVDLDADAFLQPLERLAEDRNE